MDNFLYILLLLTTVVVIFLVLNNGKETVPTIPLVFSILLMLIAFNFVAFYPIVLYNDKSKYLADFLQINPTNIMDQKDIGWAYYTYLIKSLFNDSEIYFILTAMIYILGYFVFAQKYLHRNYIFIYLLASFCSFGFFAYGVNTLRAGFALSLFLAALAFKDKKGLFIILSILAILCHKSLILPIGAFLLTTYITNSKLYIYLWITALVVSIINISPVTNFMETYVFSIDERGVGYFDPTSNLNYKAGFRVDFVIYSAIPILIGFWYIFKVGVKDAFYIRLCQTYIVSNALWLIVIRMNFTDRVAYLSWFLIPIILLYPLLKYKLPLSNQSLIIVCTLTGIVAFTSLMFFK